MRLDGRQIALMIIAILIGTTRLAAQGCGHQPAAAGMAPAEAASDQKSAAPTTERSSGSFWPFGRKANEKPDELVKKEQELIRTKRESEEAGASPEALEALDLKLEEIRLRREIATLRATRDKLRARGGTEKAKRLDEKINQLKTGLDAVRIKQRRVDDADPQRSSNGESAGSARSGAGSTHGGHH